MDWMRVSCLVIAIGTLLWTSPGLADEQQIRRWVEQLAANEYGVRQAASKKLRQAGRPAERWLELAARGQDLERRHRAEEILKDFRYGIYPDTPKDLAQLLRRYRGGDARIKRQVVRTLAQLGPSTHRLLLKLSTMESDPQVRERVFDRLLMVDLLIVGRKFDAAERLMERHAYRSFAICALLRGTLPAKIKQYRERQEKTPSIRTAVMLTHLYRMADKLPQAWWAAAQSKDLELQAGILHLLGRWKELAPIEDKLPHEADDEGRLGYRAGCHRLAGNRRAYEGIIAKLRKLPLPAEDSVDSASGYLLANGEVEAAIERLGRGKKTNDVFNLLVQQLRFEQAFALARRVRQKGTARERFLMELAIIRQLPSLGDEGGYRRRLRAALESPQARKLGLRSHVIYLPYRMGRVEFAFRLCGEALSRKPAPEDAEDLLGGVFEGKWPPGHIWRFLSETDPHRRLAQLRRINAGTFPLKALRRILDQAEKQLPGLEVRRRTEWLAAMGSAGYKGRALSRALRYFARNGDTRAQGDVLARMGRWQQAAEHYRQAYEKQTLPAPYLMYLRGWAVTRSGRKREGQVLILQADLLAGTDVFKRQQVIWMFAEKQSPETVARQRWLTGRMARMRSWKSSSKLWRAARTARRTRRFIEAADLYERSMLGRIRSGTGYSQMADYLEVAHWICSLRARGYLARGKVDRALAEARRAMRLLPGDVELIEQLVPKLGKRGDVLFDKVWKLHAAVVRAYPKSAQHHHSLARLGASCRRKVELAISHARKAIALDPKSATYKKTLKALLAR